MNSGETPASVERAEQRIDRAVDAIRGMSRDLADELAPSPTLLDRVSAATRDAPIQALAHVAPAPITAVVPLATVPAVAPIRAPRVAPWASAFRITVGSSTLGSPEGIAMPKRSAPVGTCVDNRFS